MWLAGARAGTRGWHTRAAVPYLGGSQLPSPTRPSGPSDRQPAPADVPPSPLRGRPERPGGAVPRAQTRAVQRLLQKLLDSPPPPGTRSVARNPAQRRGGSSRRAAGRAAAADGSEAGSELTRLAWARRGPESVPGPPAGASVTWRSSPPAAAMAHGDARAQADTGGRGHPRARPDLRNPARGSPRPHVGGARGPRVAAPPAPAAAPLPGP